MYLTRHDLSLLHSRKAGIISLSTLSAVSNEAMLAQASTANSLTESYIHLQQIHT